MDVKIFAIKNVINSQRTLQSLWHECASLILAFVLVLIVEQVLRQPMLQGTFTVLSKPSDCIVTGISLVILLLNAFPYIKERRLAPSLSALAGLRRFWEERRSKQNPIA